MRLIGDSLPGMVPGFERTGEMLHKLSEVGKPRLSRMNDGKWFAEVEFPSPQGVTAKVASDYKHATPDEALQCCIDRLGGLRSMLSVPTPRVGADHTEIAA